MKLAYKKYGSGPPFVILHGLFGSGDNWQTMAKDLAEWYTVYLVDQRNHGHSPHTDSMSYELMADDVRDFMEEHQLRDVILMGHSMGGKAAIRAAQKYPQYLSKLIVVDIGVKNYPPHHQDILAGFESVDLQAAESRGDAEEMMKAKVPGLTVRQFLLKNLYWKSKGKLAWRINLPVLKANMEEIGSGLPADKVEIPTLFVRGARSNYILEEDYPALLEQFPNGKIESLEVGHWVHAEDPEGLLKILLDFATRA